MSERGYLAAVLLLPAFAFAVVASCAAAAGCYSSYMNCFSITTPDDSLSRATFFIAAFTPFAGPAYLPIAAGGLAALFIAGERALDKWQWLAPLAFAALVHAACVVFAEAALPARRIVPSLGFDALVAAAGFAYLGLTRLMKPAVLRMLTRKPRRRR